MAGVARYDDQVRWDDDESYIHEDSLIVDARASLNTEQVAGGYDVGVRAADVEGGLGRRGDATGAGRTPARRPGRARATLAHSARF
jgi:hypothetical protein